MISVAGLDLPAAGQMCFFPNSSSSPIQIQSAENDPSCRCCWGILWAYFFNLQKLVQDFVNRSHSLQDPATAMG